jgi:hypothetical protein
MAKKLVSIVLCSAAVALFAFNIYGWSASFGRIPHSAGISLQKARLTAEVAEQSAGCGFADGQDGSAYVTLSSQTAIRTTWISKNARRSSFSPN